MDVHGCANLNYARGDFIDGDPEDCGGSTGSSVQFDDIGRADFQLIKDALAASGTPIERVGGRFLSDGRVRWAWFMSHHGAPRDVVVAGVRPCARARGGRRDGDAHARRGRAGLVVLLLRGLTMGAVVRGADLREHELHSQGVPQVKRVGRLGLEPRTNGLKVRCSAN